MHFLTSITLTLLGTIACTEATSSQVAFQAPAPEPIEITELPLPPVVATNTTGSCTLAINPQGTGCMGLNNTESGTYTQYLFGGGFLPDGKHVLAAINFIGAPASPDPASIYSGVNLVIVKADGTTFPNGDGWKCITCGVSAANKVGSTTVDQYAMAFRDGKRVIVGNNIVDCGTAFLNSTDCTPDLVHIYPMYMANTADGSGSGIALREMRLHPDNVHVSLNTLLFVNGAITQYPFFARMVFNPAPTTGTPLTARYDLVNATLLHCSTCTPSLSVDGSKLLFNPDAIAVGELRGFSGNGNEITYVGTDVESCNIDLFAADLSTGAVRRLTRHPGYVDPVDFSHDDQWQVILDTRDTDRMNFMSAMRGVPPLIDPVVNTVVSSVRNNGLRRFFQPYLLTRDGDQDPSYYGQLINAAGNGSAGSINDPNWDAFADPRWSFDGTLITYHQGLVQSPACGGANPLPCPDIAASGGRTWRLMLANLTSRSPIETAAPAEHSDVIPWGLAYVPGSTLPNMTTPLPAGNYTLSGNSSGYADVNVISTASVAVTYHNYSDDGLNFIEGSESVTGSNSLTLYTLHWESNLTSTGANSSTKVTSPGGADISIDLDAELFEANGTLTTTVDGVVFNQPQNDT
ncbi:hypothetical protein BP5796_09316 [Coleophoma crateriformis]|uniref:Saponin hydrolase n=1 Tax=Coleophoma crateriformis TaxID=565419 RepID=A0A3D8R3S4_9HELO|nr:hypothetical protein BP5796_09316 [Coleophoma crateriformis]